ncbi:MAG: hypothetical protein SGBAC_004156 [Bacillariaceae sp.]
MSNRVNTIAVEDEVEERQSLLEEALRALSRNEHSGIEATSLRELHLWKSKLLKWADASSDDASSFPVDVDDRRAYRIRSGASIGHSEYMIALLYETSIGLG